MKWLLALLVLGACDRVLGLKQNIDAPPMMSPDAAVGYGAAVLADQPLAFWRLDSPGIAVDETGNGNMGTLMNGVAVGQPGALVAGGKAMGFDGTDDFITFGNRLGFPGTAPFTLELWVKPKSHLVNYPGVIAKTDESGGGNDKVGYLMYDHFSVFGVERHESITKSHAVTTTGALPADVWAYVVATYDGTTLALYIDGELKDSDTTPISIPQTSKPLVLGGRNGGAYLHYAGALDEVAIYDHALTQGRIDAHRLAAFEQ